MGKRRGRRLGGVDDGLVSGDGSHGRERVHGLRAADARHQLHAEQRDVQRDRGGQSVGRIERAQKPDYHCARLEQGLVGGAGGVDDGQQVGMRQNGCAIARDRCAGLDVGSV